MINQWLVEKIRNASENRILIVDDPHKIITNHDPLFKRDIETHNFIAIFASTNLVFRELLFHARRDDKEKIILIDQTPSRRKDKIASITRAPPLFYPDLLDGSSEDNYIKGDIQQFLIEKTEDKGWPKKANFPPYARIIKDNIEHIVRAHRELRKVDKVRFSDEDFIKIIAFSALEMPTTSFSKLNPTELWKISFSHRETLKNLANIAPEVIEMIRGVLRDADKPFCWLVDYPVPAVKVFYLSLILSQHFKHWNLLLANIDSQLSQYKDVDIEIIKKASDEIFFSNSEQTSNDIFELEDTLTDQDIEFLLFDQKKIATYEDYESIIANEKYSTLIISIATLYALYDLLLFKHSQDKYEKIYDLLFKTEDKFLDVNPRKEWNTLKNLYKIVYEIQKLKRDLKTNLRLLEVKETDDVNFIDFWNIWNKQKINRLEYYTSKLERDIGYEQEYVKLTKKQLTKTLTNLIVSIKEAAVDISKESENDVNKLNLIYQQLVQKKYPSWIRETSDVVFTSQFLDKMLKPYWDPENEKAVIMIFDGLRYDIWDEFLRPIVAEYTDPITTVEKPGVSILPTETHITRKALSAGSFPNAFSTGQAENVLLSSALEKRYKRKFNIEKIEPDRLGLGETVRYSGKNLDVFIFDLCDSILHNIPMKRVGRRHVPARPLDLIYNQIRNVFEKEVLGIIRNLEPKTKIFITADHGFRKVNRKVIQFDIFDLNDDRDCRYLNCRLAVPADKTRIVKQHLPHIIRFTPEEIKLQEKYPSDRRTDKTENKQYAEIVFSSIEYAFKRPGSGFRPDAWSHGGISLQEMIIPMVVTTIKDPDSGQVQLSIKNKNIVFMEGEPIRFDVSLTSRSAQFTGEMRIDVEAGINTDLERVPLDKKIIILQPWQEQEIQFKYNYQADELSQDARKKGQLNYQFTVTASYRHNGSTQYITDSHDFSIQLNTERIVRRVGSLGNILGLSVKKRNKVSA